jgi:hypothetical protein
MRLQHFIDLGAHSMVACARFLEKRASLRRVARERAMKHMCHLLPSFRCHRGDYYK